MEALGEEAGWKREDEGGQAMESLGTEAREERLGAREERLGAREERLEAKERVENRKEKRSFFIKSCTKKGRNLVFFVTNNVKNVTF